MNKYKIEIKEVLKKVVMVEAKDEKQALDFIEKTFFKSNLLDLTIENLEEAEVKIIEKNNKKIEENENFLNENHEEIDEEIENITLEKLEKLLAQSIKRK